MNTDKICRVQPSFLFSKIIDGTMHMSGTKQMQSPVTQGESYDSFFRRFAPDRHWIQEGVAFVVLVGAGVALRLAFRDLPNFAPVAALALFAGYFFRSALLALCVPLSVMALSDWFLGGYNWYMMALVYGMLAMPVALRGLLRRSLAMQPGCGREAFTSAAGLVGCGLGSSLLFFLVTNFGVWMWFGTYESSWSGLAHCYAAALPFFRYTITGDLFFSVVLFGSYALSMSLAATRIPAVNAS